MAWPETEIESISIVLKGAFNPAIFSPAWMRSEKLIGETEYKAASVDLITRELTIFSTAWLRVQAQLDTLQISTVESDEYERARDVAIGILRSLPHTPVAALGINREVHFAVESPDQWHSIGDALAPKQFWESSLRVPGLRDLTIWGVRDDLHSGHVQVTFQPSQRIALGIFMTHNDHFNLSFVEAQPNRRIDNTFLPPSTDASPDKVKVALSVLADEWEKSMDRAAKVFGAIASLARSL